MGHLYMECLGSPEVRHDQRVLAFRTRKTLALLVYLVVERGMHSREKITSSFWLESDEPQGRAMLRNTLLYLRRALEDHEPSHLIVDRHALGFDFTSDFELDLRSVEVAFARTRAPAAGQVLEGDERRHLLVQLQDAVAAYRGSFLEGFFLDDAPDFEHWLQLQREVWHRRMSTVYDHLSSMQLDGGELPGAIEATTRWVAHESFNERAHRRLMQSYFAAGDRNAALRAYQNCRKLFAEELRAQPAPETQVLAERIRTQPLPPRMPALAAQKPAPLDSAAALPELPLIGRVQEYTRLIEAYHTVQGGRSQAVILKGEAGVGKTRLAVDFLGWAAAHDADILLGRAFETGGRLPYQPLVEALRNRIERENAPDDLLSDTWLAELSRLLPEMRDRYPDLPPPTADEATARIRLFEAATRLGEALAVRSPIILFIDDMQWADAASLDMLHYAARRWRERGSPLLLLLGVRSEALLTATALSAWFTDLERDLHATSLVLQTLTPENTLQLIAVLGGSRPAEKSELEELGRWLFTETRGLPFYMTEILKALLERNVLALRFRAPGSWTIDFTSVMHNTASLQGLLPSGMRELIRTRLSQLTPATSALLVAGAVLDHDFPFEHLYQVAGLGVNEALPALDEGLTTRLFRTATREERHSSAETYFFTHDKIRDVVYTEAGETRRRIFHQRAYETLSAAAARRGTRGVSPSELAHHALAAGLTEAAFTWSVAAGDEAIELFAVRDAIAHYEQARRVLADLGEQAMAPLSIQHLSVHLGRSYELNNEFARAETVYQGLLAFARTSDLPAMECTALNALATLAFQSRYDVASAGTLLHQALQIAERLGESIELAETAWNLAQLGFYRFDPPSGILYGEHALAIARQLNQQELLARSLNVLSHAHSMAGHWEESERHAREGQLVYQALKNRAMEADCLAQIATDRINLGRTQAGIDAAQEAYTISLQIENAWGQVNSMLPLAQGLLELGRYTQALEFAQRAAQLARSNNMFVLLSLILPPLGAVYRAMLALDTARSIHLEGLRQYEPMGPPLIEMFAAELCSDYALAGAWEEAYTHAQRVLESRTDTIVLSTRLTLWYEIEALVRAGEIERATEDVQRFGERIGNSRRYRIPYLRALAVLAKSRGEIDEAAQHLQEAATLSEEIGLPGELWPIQGALGDLYLMQGDKEQARSAFKQATTIVRKLADTIGSDEQRANFLASPLVQRVLDK